MKIKMLFLLFFTMISCISLAMAEFPVERRKDQFQNTPGYFLIPAPYVLPGIGEGIFVVGYAGNILETPTDTFVVVLTGDVEATAVSVDEFFVPPFQQFFYFSALRGTASKFGQNVYPNRGMDNEKDDFSIIVGEEFSLVTYEFTLTLFERRFELTYGSTEDQGQFTELRDHEGNLLQTYSDPIRTESSSTFSEAKFDFTDDYTFDV